MIVSRKETPIGRDQQTVYGIWAQQTTHERTEPQDDIARPERTSGLKKGWLLFRDSIQRKDRFLIFEFVQAVTQSDCPLRDFAPPAIVKPRPVNVLSNFTNGFHIVVALCTTQPKQ
jgi:hypothetical protein